MTDELAAFNALSESAAREQLRRCLGITRWVDDLSAARPYRDLAALQAAARVAAPGLSDAELDDALAGHPRIGERAGAGHDAELSSREQAGVPGSDADVQERLRAGNAAYEERFGHVFLIRAAGRSSAEILAELERRLGNDPATERGETEHNLREIAVLRLALVV